MRSGCRRPCRCRSDRWRVCCPLVWKWGRAALMASRSSSGVTLRAWPLSLRACGYAGDAVVLVAVEPGLDGAPGELAGLPCLVEEGHGGDLVHAFVAGLSGRCRWRRGRAFSDRPKAVSWDSPVRTFGGRLVDLSTSEPGLPRRLRCRPAVEAVAGGGVGRCARNVAMAAERARRGDALSGVSVDGPRFASTGRCGGGGSAEMWRKRAQTKKVRSVCWKAAMGESASGKAARRWARTCAARLGGSAGARAVCSGPTGHADAALAELEAFPDALPGPLAERSRRGATGLGDTAGDGPLEERAGLGGQAEASDFVGEPDAESAAATGLACDYSKRAAGRGPSTGCCRHSRRESHGG